MCQTYQQAAEHGELAGFVTTLASTCHVTRPTNPQNRYCAHLVLKGIGSQELLRCCGASYPGVNRKVPTAAHSSTGASSFTLVALKLNVTELRGTLG